MGPTCPACGAIYEWTQGEIDECVVGPKLYFCQRGECRHMWIVDGETIAELQARFRPFMDSCEGETYLTIEEGYAEEPFLLPSGQMHYPGRDDPATNDLSEDLDDLALTTHDVPTTQELENWMSKLEYKES